jgi:hypothetical protein
VQAGDGAHGFRWISSSSAIRRRRSMRAGRCGVLRRVLTGTHGYSRCAHPRVGYSRRGRVLTGYWPAQPSEGVPRRMGSSRARARVCVLYACARVHTRGAAEGTEIVSSGKCGGKRPNRKLFQRGPVPLSPVRLSPVPLSKVKRKPLQRGAARRLRSVTRSATCHICRGNGMAWRGTAAQRRNVLQVGTAQGGTA